MSNWKELTFSQKCAHVRRNISVEPTLAFFVMPSILSGLATQNLFLEKACRVNLGYKDEVCDALRARDTANYTIEEKAVQSIVANMMGWKTILQSLLPCIFILFWGSWSDRHGRRKPCMIIPIVGEILANISLMINMYFKKWPMEIAGISEVIFPGLSGGWFLMLLGVFSYTADITTQENRTFRIGLVNIFFTISFPLGMGFSGILLKKIGFYGVFSVSASLLFLNLLYTFFCIKDLKNKKGTIKQNKLADFFDTAHVVDTFKVAFKKTTDRRRGKLIALIIVAMLLIGPLHGEIAVQYLFTRFRFNWTEVEYSIFSTYSMALQMIGTFFAVYFLSKKFKVSDCFIGIIASVSKILSSFVFAFAVTGRQFFIGPIIEFMKETAFISMRSMTSKLVDSDELGKINSIIGIAEGLMPLIFAPMYTQLYRASLDILPGAFYLLGGALTIPIVFMYLWLHKVQKKEKRAKAKDSNVPEASTLLEENNTDIFLQSMITEKEFNN